jgi:predicted RNase H-like nuclease (RuvC/YqgF family)
MNKKPLNSVKSIKMGDKISLHKNKSNNQKINSITLSRESLIKAPSQFLAYKYLRPNSIKEKYDIVMINKPYKSINTNNYIINTLNVSEKNFANNSVMDKKNLEKDFNKYKKEKEELDNKIKEQKSNIEKLIERNKKLDEKFNEVSQENTTLKKKYSSLKENQEQLIMLIKIIQENGIDVDGLIDKWNNEVEMEEKNAAGGGLGEPANTKSVDAEKNKEQEKLEFLPITVENSLKSRSIIKGVPKLNFEVLKK